MKNLRALKSVASVSTCAFVLAAALGCSSAKPTDTSSDTTEDTAPITQQDDTSTTDSQQAEPAPTDDNKLTAESAAAQGYQVFEGTVRVVSPEELVELQGVDIDPAQASGGGTYAVLVFDQETDVTGMLADGSGEHTRSAKVLGIAEHTDYDGYAIDYGNLDSWRDLDGQHVTLAALAENIMFPTDVRLPLGEPSASSVTVLS